MAHLGLVVGRCTSRSQRSRSARQPGPGCGLQTHVQQLGTTSTRWLGRRQQVITQQSRRWLGNKPTAKQLAPKQGKIEAGKAVWLAGWPTAGGRQGSVHQPGRLARQHPMREVGPALVTPPRALSLHPPQLLAVGCVAAPRGRQEGAPEV